MKPSTPGDDVDHRLVEDRYAKERRSYPLQSLIIRLVRAAAGPGPGEELLKNVGLDPLRSFFYAALKRLDAVNPSRSAPVSYYEFGVGGGGSLTRYIDALRASVHDRQDALQRFHFVLFDSFQGLPPKKGTEDDHPAWTKGTFSCDVPAIRRIIAGTGLDPSSKNFRFVEGFFDRSLTPELRESLSATPPSLVNIDVDYYSSAKTVLEWVRPLLPAGTIFYFDDVWDFNGDPDRGELKAIKEFNSAGRGRLHPLPLVPALEGQCFAFHTSE